MGLTYVKLSVGSELPLDLIGNLLRSKGDSSEVVGPLRELLVRCLEELHCAAQAVRHVHHRESHVLGE